MTYTDSYITRQQCKIGAEWMSLKIEGREITAFDKGGESESEVD